MFPQLWKTETKRNRGNVYGDDFHEKAPKGILTTLSKKYKLFFWIYQSSAREKTLQGVSVFLFRQFGDGDDFFPLLQRDEPDPCVALPWTGMSPTSNE